MLSRAAILGIVLLLVILPQLDQFVCLFCGPSVETSANGVDVGLADQDCPLRDTVKRTSSNSQETDHIHLCTLHSTHLLLASHWRLARLDTHQDLFPFSPHFISAELAVIDHPPRLS